MKDKTLTPTEFRRRRKLLNLTQVDLAARLQVHMMTVSRWERGGQSIPYAVGLALTYLESEQKENPSTINGVEQPEKSPALRPQIKREEMTHMKKTDEAITKEYLNQRIAVAAGDAKEHRQRLSEAQKETNVADERLHALRRARAILFGEEVKTCCP